MNYADIKQYDVANGPGVRVSVFVSGCTHYCKGCFNEEAWDFSYGKPFTEETIENILLYLKPSYVKGLTVLGGEPMHPKNQPDVLKLLKKVREMYPEKSVWMFSGYEFETEILTELLQNIPETKEILSLTLRHHRLTKVHLSHRRVAHHPILIKSVTREKHDIGIDLFYKILSLLTYVGK